MEYPYDFTTDKRKAVLVLILIFISTSVSVFAQEKEKFDLKIMNGKVLDGTGNPWYYSDIGVKDGRIVKLGDLSNDAAQDTMDAKGLFVSPGFIDVHSHAASGLTKSKLSNAEPLVRQGITTVMVNPDGGGAMNLKKQREELLKDGLGVNVAQLIPHGAIRREVIGMEDRSATSNELEQMKNFVRQGMENGAFGLSSGPFYAPGSYASTQELVDLATVAASFDGVYTSHIRDESNYTIGLEKAVDEVITVAREAGLPGIVTHIKALGPPVWGFSSIIEENIESARAKGIEVFADQYPYEASATGLISALVPRWAEEGGHDALVSRLEDAETLAKIKAEMKENLFRRGGADRIQFRYYSPDSSIEGKTLQEVSEERNEAPLDVAIELISKGQPDIVSFNMKKEDVYRFMRQPWTMTSSDGGLVAMGEGVPHPRNYGAFPRKIRKYVVDEQVIDLSFAIRSMTSLPATVFNMKNRGLIREGMTADLIIWDLNLINDKAEFQAPHQLSEGMIHVLINGRYAIHDGQFLNNLPGQILLHDPD